LDAKIKTISDDAIIRTKTKAKANAALVDPISAVAGARLLPYQQRLAGYCNRIRYIRSVLNWNESIISFFTTLIFFGAGIVALFIPWRFLLQWASRLIVWIFLGPWMRLFDLFFHEETERQKANASKEAMKLFLQQQKTAKMIRENALKVRYVLQRLLSLVRYFTFVFSINHCLCVILDESIAGKIVWEVYHQTTGVQSNPTRRCTTTSVMGMPF
jgi:hypothetical protein